jgi:hypothetical protein
MSNLRRAIRASTTSTGAAAAAGVKRPAEAIQYVIHLFHPGWSFMKSGVKVTISTTRRHKFGTAAATVDWE